MNKLGRHNIWYVAAHVCLFFQCAMDIQFYRSNSDFIIRKYQLGPYNMGIKLFNTLPSSLKIESHNPSRFRTLRKKNFPGVISVFFGRVLQYL